MARAEPHRQGRGLIGARPLVLCGAAVLAGAAFYGVAVEPHRIERLDLTVPIRGLPPAFEGYRILHVSDFEASGPGGRERQVERIARASRPDLIAVTGDIVKKSLDGGAKWEAVRAMAAFLGSLPSRDGVYFVQGHGEHVSRFRDGDFLEQLRAEGVRPLYDDVAVMRRGAAALVVAGVKVHDFGSQGRWEVATPRQARVGPGGLPSFLEAAGGGSLLWRDHDLETRLRLGSAGDWAGVLVHSRLQEGHERYYVVRRRPDHPFLTASARGTTFTRGRLSRRTLPEPGAWTRIRVRVSTRPDRVVLLARAWTEGEPEPDSWDVEYEDAGETRIEQGAAGLYAEGPGSKQFDELTITPAAAGTSWAEPAGSVQLMGLLDRAPEGAPVVLLSHSPDVFPEAAELDIPLVLAGHTQGGQICLPLLGPLVTDTRLGRAYAAGLIERGRSILFVTRGVGVSRIPVRFLSPPEAAVITLTRG